MLQKPNNWSGLNPTFVDTTVCVLPTRRLIIFRKIRDNKLLFFVVFYYRCQRQRSFLPVIHLRGHGAWRSTDWHIGRSGLSDRPRLGSAWDGNKPLLWSLGWIFTSSSSYFLNLFSASSLQIHYTILKDESGDSQYFSIDSRSGVVVTRASFDREQKASYLIEVQSQDGSESARPGQQGQPNTGTPRVIISFTDCIHLIKIQKIWHVDIWCSNILKFLNSVMI